MLSTFCSIHKNIGLLVVFLLAIWATSAGARDLKCSLANPKYEEAATSAVFRIELECGNGVEQPVKIADGAHLLIGLTLYSVPPIGEDNEYAQINQHVGSAPAGSSQFSDEVNGYTIEQKPLIAGASPRQVLRDWNISNPEDDAPLDFDVQKAVADHKTKKYTFEFKADPSAIKPYNSYVFAVWQAGDKVKCDPAEDFARSGCKDFGYVFGDSGVFPLDFYPGAVSVGDDRSMWIVERFR